MSVRKDLKILFLGKRDDWHGERALAYLRGHFEFVDAHQSTWGAPMPEVIAQWSGDLIISYLSRWIVPAPVLERATVAAINFHPASPDFPGVGCTNFALYQGASHYGCTCHHMSATVDTGAIIRSKRFPVYDNDTVKSLLQRTYDCQLGLFYEVMDDFNTSGKFTPNGERWTRKPYSRREFNELTKLDISMSEEEVQRRVRATHYEGYSPELRFAGYDFVLKQSQ
jgi:methionyl-tRNA formyltransferase